MEYDLLSNTDNIPKAPFIAEAGINHDGDIDIAKKMVDIAADAQAAYVKFQSFKANKLVTPDALTSSYIDAGSQKDETFEDLLKRLELSIDDHYELKEYCMQKNIKFLSTAFDNKSFDLLMEIGSDIVKVASVDITNIPFVRYMAQRQLPMIVSTGMASLGEIEDVVKAISIDEQNNQIILLHCISWYPADIMTTNLNYINTLKSAFGYPVGYSDHTLGDLAAITSISLGSCVIEKHFTLDKSRNSFDHNISLEPKEFNSMVKKIRIIEKMLNTDTLLKSSTEEENKKWMRRIVFAKDNLKDNKQIKMNDILFIRKPFSKKNISASATKKIIGKKIKKAVKKFQPILWRNLN